MQRPLHLNLRIHAPGNLKTRNPVRDPKQRRITPVSVAGNEDQIARPGPFKHRGQQDQRLGRPGVPDRIPKRFLHLALHIKSQAAQGAPQRLLAGSGNSRVGNVLGFEMAFLQQALHGFRNKTVIAELVLESAGKRFEVVLLFGSPRAEKLLADRMSAN